MNPLWSHPCTRGISFQSAAAVCCSARLQEELWSHGLTTDALGDVPMGRAGCRIGSAGRYPGKLPGAGPCRLWHLLTVVTQASCWCIYITAFLNDFTFTSPGLELLLQDFLLLEAVLVAWPTPLQSKRYSSQALNQACALQLQKMYGTWCNCGWYSFNCFWQ